MSEKKINAIYVVSVVVVVVVVLCVSGRVGGGGCGCWEGHNPRVY